MMDILNDIKRIKRKMKKYNFMLGDCTHFKLLEPSNYIKKATHRNTDYYYFDCELISKDHELIPIGKHTIQLPSKRVVYPLIMELKQKDKLNGPVNVTITRKGQSLFKIIIH